MYIPDIPGGGAWQKLYKAKATYDKVNWFQVEARTSWTARGDTADIMTSWDIVPAVVSPGLRLAGSNPL